MTAVGIKHDEEKPRTDLLPPEALLEIARVLGWGAGKYNDNNWRAVPDSTRRYTAAALRHLFEFMSGEQHDAESGLSHLAHAACSLMFAIELGGDPQDFTAFHKTEEKQTYNPHRFGEPEPTPVELDLATAREIHYAACKVEKGDLIGVLTTNLGDVELRKI